MVPDETSELSVRHFIVVLLNLRGSVLPMSLLAFSKPTVCRIVQRVGKKEHQRLCSMTCHVLNGSVDVTVSYSMQPS